jgi:hypothetical protein
MSGSEYDVSSSERGYFLPQDDVSYRALNHLLMHGVPGEAIQEAATFEVECPDREDAPVSNTSDLIDGYSGSSIAPFEQRNLERAIQESEQEHEQESERNRDAEQGFLSLESGAVTRADVATIFSEAARGTATTAASPSMFGMPANATVDFGPKRRFRRSPVDDTGRFPLRRRPLR